MSQSIYVETKKILDATQGTSGSSDVANTLRTNTVATQAPLQNGGTIHTPIPEIEVPVILDKFIIAVRVDTNVPVNSKWDFAGYCKQKISTGLVVGGSQDATNIRFKPLRLNQNNLIDR